MRAGASRASSGSHAVAAAARRQVKGIELSLFRDPDRLAKAIKTARPAVLGFCISNWNLDLTRRVARLVAVGKRVERHFGSHQDVEWARARGGEHEVFVVQARPVTALPKKPENGGMPEIATHAQTMVQKVQGIFLRNPPMLRRSCSPESAWITLPAPRKSSALKNACVTRW